MSLINNSSTSPDENEAPMGARNVGYAEDTPVSTDQFLSSEFDSGPTSSIMRAAQRAGDTFYSSAINAPKLSADEINAQYGPIGADGKQVKITDQPMYANVAQTISRQKGDEMDRNAVIDRYTNQHNTVQNFGVGLVGFMLDPLNAASNFIPGVGEETALSAIGRAGLDTSSVVSRTAARTVSGATAGAISQAPLTALKYGLDQQQASDYDLRSAFKDVMYAAAGNAIIHAGFFGTLHETGLLKPDDAMKFQPKSKDASSEIQSVFNADATSKHAAMQAAVGQLVEGREVDVDPIFQKPGEQNPSTVGDIAEKQAQTYRDGFAPNLTTDQLEAAKSEILPDKEEKPVEKSLSNLDPKVIDRYKSTIQDVAAKNGIPVDDAVISRAAQVMAESHNVEMPSTPKLAVGASPTKPIGEFPKLPKELSKASPRYKTLELSFKNDVDRALYIVRERSSGKSAAHDKYMSYLKDTVGLSDQEIRSGSENVKNAVKANAEGAEGKVQIPLTFKRNAPEVVKPVVTETSKETPYVKVPQRPDTLSEFLTKNGGLEGGELKAMDADKAHLDIATGKPKPFQKKLVRDDGLSLEDAGMKAKEAGYFPELGDARPTSNQLLEKLGNDLRGEHQHSELDTNSLQAHNDALNHNAEIDRVSSETGIDTKGKTRQQFFDEVSKRYSEEQKAHIEQSAIDSWKTESLEPEELQNKTPEELEHEWKQEQATKSLEPIKTSSKQPGNVSGSEGHGETGNGSVGSGAEPAGREDEAGSGNESAEQHPDDVAIKELEAKLDTTKMTGEEMASIQEAHANSQIANELYQQKLQEYAACLAENG
jgi:hypothetical protein